MDEVGAWVTQFAFSRMALAGSLGNQLPSGNQSRVNVELILDKRTEAGGSILPIVVDGDPGVARGQEVGVQSSD